MTEPADKNNLRTTRSKHALLCGVTLRGTMVAAALFWALACCRLAVGQEDQILIDLNRRVEFFFNNLDTADDLEKAFEDILVDGPLSAPDRRSATTNLIRRFESLQSRCGKYLSAESLTSKKIGSDLVYLRFLYKAEQFPVAWHFVFYHRADEEKTKWVLVSLRFDTKLEALGK